MCRQPPPGYASEVGASSPLNLLVCGGGSAPLAIPQWRRFLIAFP